MADGNMPAIDGETLRRYVEPIEELMSDRRALNRKITATYRKAKEAGYQAPILRMLIAERMLERQVWADQQVLLQQYREALGMRLGDYVDTPLGAAAMARAEDDVTTQRAARDVREGTVDKPKPFAEQTLYAPSERPPRGRGRPKKVLFDQEHPQGTA